MAPERKFRVTRRNLKDGVIRKMAEKRNDGEDGMEIASDEQLLASRREIVPDDADVSDIWVFGYGSLIFNPVMKHIECAPSRIYGYHRRFCLWTRLGRGSPDCPGLVLSLDRGGSCAGISYRLDKKCALAELDLLWRREMVTLSYRARLLNIHTPRGKRRAIAFVSRTDCAAYATPMTLEREAEVIARAVGFIGPCHEYLFDTLEALRANGIADPHMERLARTVKRRLA